MKKILIILFFAISLINASELILTNAKQEILNLKNVSKDKLVSFEIFEPYKKEFTNFQGITLKTFVEEYGHSKNKLVLKALDDYKIVFEKKHINNENIILVFKEKNKFLTPDIKGPARIIYRNYRKDQNAIYLTKWIWMIAEAEFK